ncbi:MAG: heme-binding protein [Verrucomicrobiae bacterium]|nr:heme-binding protein [Verrucomicrobiae bacterium]
MNRRFSLALIAVAAGGALGIAGCQVTRAGYESAPYQVLFEEEGVEVRQYPALRVARTPASGDDFMRLFRYISKGNEAEQKIAMTTPVLMAGVGTTNASMAFVLPAGLDAPPAPTGDAVAVTALEPATYAVRRFRGSRQGADGDAVGELEVWMRARNLPQEGAPVFAYYDPPWIPGFLRRNEVMIPTTWKPGAADVR